MKRESQLLFEKAKRSLNAAESLFKEGNFDFSASRSYYAMFYAVEAILLEKGKTYSKHSGVISGFHEHFVATNELPKGFHQDLHQAFEDREEADYAFLDPFPKEEAEDLLGKARAFVAGLEEYLRRDLSNNMLKKGRS